LKAVHGCDHVILCSSGRAAVELALQGLRVEPSDEVAMAAYDFESNFTGIQKIGTNPVLVDIREDDAQLDVCRIESALSPKTKAVIVSHLHGGLVDMPALQDLADANKIAIIEDACQASGANVCGRPVGTWGDVGVLSFGGSKLLTAGRGGALLTNRADVVQRIRRHLRGDNHAYPLSEMQAALLLPQLQALPDRHRQRAEAVRQIASSVADTSGFAPMQSGLTQSDPAYYKLAFLYEPEHFGGLSRQTFVDTMKAEGLAIDTGWEPLHATHSSRRFRAASSLDIADRVVRQIVSLHHPVLLDVGMDWSRLCKAVERVQCHADRLIGDSSAVPLRARSTP
jgi:dTDP-4-amino-4,6-dideoxygalactose transaminase